MCGPANLDSGTGLRSSQCEPRAGDGVLICSLEKWSVLLQSERLESSGLREHRKSIRSRLPGINSFD